MSTNLPSLNGIRALCIVSVLGAHACRSLGFPESWIEPSRYVFNGGLGVTVFFVLSGFLITYLLARERAQAGAISLKKFYVRRSIRILPVYFLFILLLAILDFSTGLQIGACRYATALTFTKNFGCGGFQEGHLWSISVEEQFYILWPAAFVFLTRKSSLRLAAILIAIALPFRLYFYLYGPPQLRLTSFMTNADALMIGSLLGLMLQEHPARMRALLQERRVLRRGLAAVLIYALWIAQMKFVLGYLTVPLAATLQALAAGYLIASYAVVERGSMYRFLNLRLVNYIGVISYSIYIWQQPFFDADNPYGYLSAPFFLVFPYNLIAALAVAVMSYHLFEAPLLALRMKFRAVDSSLERPELARSPGAAA